MSFIRRLALNVASVAMLMSLSGCAMFSIDDAYRPSSSDKQDFLEMASDDVELRVSFVPETRFGSLGLLVPAVPVRVSAKRSQQVAMKVLATLPAGTPFSFVPVCLEAPTSRLCPKSVEAGIAYYYGGSEGLNWDFAQPWQIDASKPIADQDVFKHRPCRGECDWEKAQIEFTYLYECEAKCPDELSLLTDDLLLLQGKKIGTGMQHFRWGRKADYEQVILQ